jgi:hypothetical protein
MLWTRTCRVCFFPVMFFYLLMLPNRQSCVHLNLGNVSYTLPFDRILTTCGLTVHSLEEHLGIIAANLALSRYVIRFFRNGLLSEAESKSYQHHSSDTQRGLTASFPTNGRGGFFTSNSYDSTPMESCSIRKTTEFSVSEGPRDKSCDETKIIPV